MDPMSGYVLDSFAGAQPSQVPDLAALDPTLFGLKPYEEPVVAQWAHAPVHIDMSLFEDDANMWAGGMQGVESMGQQ